MYLQARTTTVKRTLIPNCDDLQFGEIPVAFKQTKEILVKNVGTIDETMRMEALTPFGGFSVLNAMRTIKPGETKPVVV
jgi:molybdenum cofactor biosynthesis enzyme